MIILMFVIFVNVLVLGCWLCEKGKVKAGVITKYCGVVGCVISFIASIALCMFVGRLNGIDERIETYQTENANLEIQIAECVQQYQEYEKHLLDGVNPESAFMVLKANTSVSRQIEIYLANNKEIKELKGLKINEGVYRWWLYFGSPQKEGVK